MIEFWHIIRRRREYGPLSWLWYLTVGYGCRTWQALIWLAGLAVAGTVVQGQAYPAHMVAVTAHPSAFQRRPGPEDRVAAGRLRPGGSTSG